LIDAGRFSAGYYEDKVKKGDRCSALLLGAFALRLRNATLSTYAVTATTNVAADSVSRDGLKIDPSAMRLYRPATVPSGRPRAFRGLGPRRRLSRRSHSSLLRVEQGAFLEEEARGTSADQRGDNEEPKLRDAFRV
jgi:hypothetical protein